MSKGPTKVELAHTDVIAVWMLSMLFLISIDGNMGSILALSFSWHDP